MEKKVRFGESPKPARESRALPRHRLFEFFGDKPKFSFRVNSRVSRDPIPIKVRFGEGALRTPRPATAGRQRRGGYSDYAFE
jgi:hypothetical protein